MLNVIQFQELIDVEKISMNVLDYDFKFQWVQCRSESISIMIPELVNIIEIFIDLKKKN